jgi:hypothetical protein
MWKMRHHLDDQIYSLDDQASWKLEVVNEKGTFVRIKQFVNDDNAAEA